MSRHHSSAFPVIVHLGENPLCLTYLAQPQHRPDAGTTCARQFLGGYATGKSPRPSARLRAPSAIAPRSRA
jgi:hypothetical protein